MRARPIGLRDASSDTCIFPFTLIRREREARGELKPQPTRSVRGSILPRLLPTLTVDGRAIESWKTEKGLERRLWNGEFRSIKGSAAGLMQSRVSHDVRAVTGGDICEGGASPPGSEIESAPRILSVLSFVVERLVARNEQHAYSQLTKSLTAFHGVRAPSISVAKYLERIYKYTNCSPSCFVVGYIYIDRLVHRQPDQPVVSLNIHRLLLTSVMVAAKFLDDVHYNNAFYARVGGVSNAELNRLELEFLFRLDFQLKVSGNEFESYCLHLEKDMLCVSAGQIIGRALPRLKGVSDQDESEDRISARSVVVGDPASR